LREAPGRRLPDVIGPGIRVLFCGINPGVYSAAVGHQFARPGNRFWKALHGAGFTERLLSPFEDRTLVTRGLGVTNVCARTTARAGEISERELRQGARILAAKVARHRPRWVAFLGVGAYRSAFGRPRAVVGLQAERIGPARVYLLPNPSGLNAHYGLPELIRQFGLFRRTAFPRLLR
jgi:TDG/mug DNA glycosylase family protein